MTALVQTIVEREGAWRRLVLNAPRGNLLSLEMVRALGAAVSALEARAGREVAHDSKAAKGSSPSARRSRSTVPT